MDEQSQDFEAFMERFEELRRTGAENVVQYAIYIINSDLSNDKIRSELNTILQTAKTFKKELLKEYIWERDAFELHLKREKCKPITRRLQIGGEGLFCSRITSQVVKDTH